MSLGSVNGKLRRSQPFADLDEVEENIQKVLYTQQTDKDIDAEQSFMRLEILKGEMASLARTIDRVSELVREVQETTDTPFKTPTLDLARQTRVLAGVTEAMLEQLSKTPKPSSQSIEQSADQANDNWYQRHQFQAVYDMQLRANKNEVGDDEQDIFLFAVNLQTLGLSCFEIFTEARRFCEAAEEDKRSRVIWEVMFPTRPRKIG